MSCVFHIQRKVGWQLNTLRLGKLARTLKMKLCSHFYLRTSTGPCHATSVPAQLPLLMWNSFFHLAMASTLEMRHMLGLPDRNKSHGRSVCQSIFQLHPPVMAGRSANRLFKFIRLSSETCWAPLIDLFPAATPKKDQKNRYNVVEVQGQNTKHRTFFWRLLNQFDFKHQIS